MDKDKNRNYFINPYNFIPLAQEKALYDEQKAENEKRYTGKITVEMTTKTPLFIPDTSNEYAIEQEKDKKNQHKSYEFFSYESNQEGRREPVIPGSSIRGMIRNIYEALTGSCMSAIDEDEQFVRRIGDTYDPGLIWKNPEGKYLLIAAQKIKIRNSECWNHIKEGTRVKYEESRNSAYVRRIEEEKEPLQGQQLAANEGFFLKGENGFKKTSYGIFKADLEEKSGKYSVKGELSHEEIENLKKVLDSYADERVNKNLGNKHHGYQEYKEEFERMCQNSGEGYFPVYYSKVGDKIYLSPSSLTKEVAYNKMHTILERQGNFQPCVMGKEKPLCPGCVLFGTVNPGGAKASRLRFADAYLTEEFKEKTNLYLHPITLEELSNPKGAPEFYLKQPRTKNGKEADFWTYDYYVVNDGKEKKIQTYIPSIAGRKFYWHDLSVNDRLSSRKKFPEREKRNKTVRPVKTEVSFTEDIYFEKVTEMQLKQLLAILNISGTKEEMGYKLGAAKPLGFGSITMKVIDCVRRTINLKGTIEYKESPIEEMDGFENWRKETEEVWEESTKTELFKKLKFSQEVKKAFLKMMSLDACEKENAMVTYPVTKNQLKEFNDKPDTTLHEKGYEWFASNHGGVKERKKMKYQEKLCKADDQHITTRALKKL